MTHLRLQGSVKLASLSPFTRPKSPMTGRFSNMHMFSGFTPRWLSPCHSRRPASTDATIVDHGQDPHVRLLRDSAARPHLPLKGCVVGCALSVKHLERSLLLCALDEPDVPVPALVDVLDQRPSPGDVALLSFAFPGTPDLRDACTTACSVACIGDGLPRERPVSRPLLSSPGWTRTNNPPVNSRMLCQLSYRGSAGTIVAAPHLQANSRIAVRMSARRCCSSRKRSSLASASWRCRRRSLRRSSICSAVCGVISSASARA